MGNFFYTEKNEGKQTSECVWFGKGAADSLLIYWSHKSDLCKYLSVYSYFNTFLCFCVCAMPLHGMATDHRARPAARVGRVARPRHVRGQWHRPITRTAPPRGGTIGAGTVSRKSSRRWRLAIAKQILSSHPGVPVPYRRGEEHDELTRGRTHHGGLMRKCRKHDAVALVQSMRVFRSRMYYN